MSTATVSKRRKLLAAILLPLILLAALVAFWPRGSAAAVTAHLHGGAAAVAPSPQTTGKPSAPPTGAPSTGRPVDPGPPSSLGSGPETSLGTAASTDPGGQRNNSSLPGKRGAIDPDGVLDPSTFGGCLAEYGDNGQCLTIYPPSLAKHVKDMVDAGLDPSTMPHDWTCTELLGYFPDGIAVRVPGVDPQKLDADSDGTACEPD